MKKIKDWKKIFSQINFPEWDKFKVKVGDQTLWLSQREILEKK